MKMRFAGNLLYNKLVDNLLVYFLSKFHNICVGHHKKGYPNQSNKKRKSQSKSSIITRARALSRLAPWPRVQTTACPTPLGLGREFRFARPPGARTRVPSRPTPLGLGREFRLARPPWPSDASSVSPDPSRARVPTPFRPIRHHSARLPTHSARTHDVTGKYKVRTTEGSAVCGGPLA